MTEKMETKCPDLCRPGGFHLTDKMLELCGLSGNGETLSVADIGCGRGGTVEYLKCRFPSWIVTGIDPDPSVCREGLILPGRAEALPFSDGSMDILIMECSFSKTEDPKLALKEAFRVLKPDGWLLMSDMYARKKAVKLDGLLGRLSMIESIRKMLVSAGFSVLEMQDESQVLAEWVGQQILDGNREKLCRILGADRQTLREAGSGYFICAAKPSDLWETLHYAEKNSPFYQERFRQAGISGIGAGDWDSFRKIPFTTAADLRENPENFLCVPPKEIARIITLRTSGSSGKPKRLFFTEGDLLRTADFFEKGMQYMVKPGDRVTVYMEGPGFFSIGGLLKEGLRRINVEVTVHGLIRDMKEAARDGEGRNCFVGVPSQMYGLAVQAPELRPETVLLSADYVPVSVKRYLEKTWKCRVFTHWGMTETGYGGGVQCGAREGYHLRDGDLLLEVIDPDTGQPVPEGEYGELVLTTLHRRGMPLIRYRTGDLGRFIYTACGCGSLKPRLAEVEGRLDDVMRLPDGKILSMHILDELLLSSGIIQDFEAFFDSAHGILKVAVMGLTEESAVSDKNAKEVAEAGLKQYFGDSLCIEVEEKNISPYIGSGKRRLKSAE